MKDLPERLKAARKALRYSQDEVGKIMGLNRTAIVEIEAANKAVIVATSARDVLEEYLLSHQHLDREIDGRLTLI